ncbi:MAG TPA: PD-(D/E)XK nuclease family protein [Acidimicrobiia bacterium]|jgi:putative RecB family exonuclease
MGVGLPRGLSPSSFSAFKDCPLAFKYAYLDRLPQPPSPPASKGTLVHRALELLMLKEPGARTLPVALADLDRARRELAEHPDFSELEMSEAEWDEFHADAEALVRRYFELEDPSTVTPIGLELRLEVPVGSVRLRGVIDRLEIDADGELVITDYKTGSVPNEYREQQRLAGVHMYAFMVNQTLGRRPVRVQLLYLSKPEAIIAVPSEQSVGAVARKTGALWSAIATACARDDFRPSPGPLCNYCTFKPYCPAFGGDPQLAAELRGPGTVIEPSLPLLAG